MWNRIINPKTRRNVNVNSKIGKSVLMNYMKQLGGAGVEQDLSDVDIKALWEWEEDELDDLNDTLELDNGIIPPKIKINTINDNIKGEYRYIGGGGGGAIYINDDNSVPIILKLIYSGKMYKNEVVLQNMAGEIAPKILYNTLLDKLENTHILLEEDVLEYWEHGDSDKVNSKIKKLVVMNDSPVNIIIMEYLQETDWKPLRYITKRRYELTDEIRQRLIDTIHSLVYEKGIYNDADLVGYTGDHIFYNKDLEKFKVIDYGAFLKVGRKNKATLMNKMLENIYNRFDELRLS